MSKKDERKYKCLLCGAVKNKYNAMWSHLKKDHSSPMLGNCVRVDKKDKVNLKKVAKHQKKAKENTKGMPKLHYINCFVKIRIPFTLGEAQIVGAEFDQE